MGIQANVIAVTGCFCRVFGLAKTTRYLSPNLQPLASTHNLDINIDIDKVQDQDIE
jgi:hypothetical protein